LNDRDEDVCKTAIASVSLLAHKGDSDVLDHVFPFAEHPSKEVRKQVMDALLQVAEIGDVQVINMILDRMEDREHDARVVAYTVAPKLVEAHDAEMMQKLVGHLQGMEMTRYAAVNELSKMATTGNALVVDILTCRLKHRKCNDRAMALKALACIVEEGDEDAISLTVRCFTDPAEVVRAAALEALCHIAGKGNENAINEAAAYLGHEDHVVRLLALIAISRVAANSDDYVAGKIPRACQKSKWGIKFVAAKALVEVAIRSEIKLVSELIDRLQYQDSGIARHKTELTFAQLACLACDQEVAASLERIHRLQGVAREAALEQFMDIVVDLNANAKSADNICLLEVVNDIDLTCHEMCQASP